MLTESERKDIATHIEILSEIRDDIRYLAEKGIPRCFHVSVVLLDVMVELKEVLNADRKGTAMAG